MTWLFTATIRSVRQLVTVFCRSCLLLLCRSTDGGTDGGNSMDITAWVVLVPVVAMLIAAIAAVVIVVVAVQDTTACARAEVLKAVAEVIRAVRGSRR
ncbi:hypothetical protein FNV62_06285 [Streptomyces sp. RLB3-17]|uniref:hypothetical protein n=1 Tax=Streptomyces TaxID=1883 RepID=UPI001165A7C9|nr:MULTISPECIES: hypothetical protein [unclassified Streptomyces]NMI55846.1 hypothetical protein [Streptomyces sp. RLA2-12]QDN55319.1 hypothetical protein FNV67_08230 [Streptomyces sp. S1D4-20]QDN65498.1 hypothetical protein FNV66_07830 [Streptomyces sp. S1D4-14]QDN75844.1 hypothetical protein FNV64_09845 [Streptomyces sp. S1A1-7]QDN85500.1 hypothetical protein FNV61_07470 [Streptomyces sp. RLB3-6]